MAEPRTITSNVSGLAYAEENSIGVLLSSPPPTWTPLDPNSYKDFGAEITTVARRPINASRQRKKGVVVDLDASGGFEHDLTQTVLQDLSQGFLFADLRRKDELDVPEVDGTGNDYQPASGGGVYVAGDLLLAKGATNAQNNGLKLVTGSPSAASVPVTDTGLVSETSSSCVITRVGFQFASGDATVNATVGAFPALETSTKDLTELGLIPGEWVYVGGDAAAEMFATAANNGLARVRSVAADAITFDKTENVMVDDSGTSKTIRIFFGARVVKNEAARADQVRRTYQLERSLGKADTTDTYDQYEYLVGAVPSKLMLTFKNGEILTVSMEFMGTDHETRDGATGPKSGTRETLVEADAYNSTGDVVRLALTPVSQVDSHPTPYFAYLTDFELTIDNSLSQNKAVGVLGAIESTEGLLVVDATASVYFTKVSSIAAVRANESASLDLTLAKANAGITFDLPLLTLGDARAELKLDEAIMLPIKSSAATGRSIDTDLDHTVLIVYWDYLPDAAMPS